MRTWSIVESSFAASVPLSLAHLKKVKKIGVSNELCEEFPKMEKGDGPA